MPAWESDFPHLGNWVQTSDATNTYNCVSYAAGDDTRWWDPLPPGHYYWPDGVGVGLAYSLERYIALYEHLGYTACQDGSLDPDKDKIVLYANQSGYFEHAARQLPDGKWTSKMDIDEDITHDTPRSLAGSRYGEPVLFMEIKKRKP
jgi:hypothetical protein